MSTDFYETLGASRDASPDDLKKAFRKLAMQYHPDKNPGDDEAEQKFKEINQAYEVLRDDQKRAAYDRYGHDAFENAAAGGGGQGGFGFGGGGFADIFDEMFGEFTGGRRGGGAARRGALTSPVRYFHASTWTTSRLCSALRWGGPDPAPSITSATTRRRRRPT